jgi:putative spermidine/putrescine transport system permease protein
MTGRGTRTALACWTVLVVLFLWTPLVVIGVYAFNRSNIQTWPIPGWTLHWWRVAWRDPDVRSSLWLSVRVGLVATGIALVFGTMAAFAIHRFRFFGRESVSFLLLLPIALPGIITGMALNSFYTTFSWSFDQWHGIPGFAIPWTIVVGHATFCVVVVYNNVLARLRRTSSSVVEASMDLGADGWQTFRYVVWPVLATALVAGGLLAFALSFDEVIVTTFTAGAQTTLPIFILDNLRQGQQLPIVNVVAFVVILLTIVPVAISQRLTRETGVIRGAVVPVTTEAESVEITTV